jgi:hypothetical protein
VPALVGACHGPRSPRPRPAKPAETRAAQDPPGPCPCALTVAAAHACRVTLIARERCPGWTRCVRAPRASAAEGRRWP